MTDSVTTPGDLRGKLMSRSFVAFLVTQFLGAMNDNIFRWIAVPLAKRSVADGSEAWVLAAGSACLVLPFILFSPYAGYLADRFSKRQVIVGCKAAEVVIMLLGAAALYVGNIYLLFGIIALMGTQSALFSPSKLGLIPEIVRGEKISGANGLVGLTTVIAVVIGSVVGNLMFAWFLDPEDVTRLVGGRINPWVPTAAIVGVAAAGWMASLFIPRVLGANTSRQFPWNPAKETVVNLRLLAKNRAILRVSFGIAFFWSVAAMAQLNVDTYAIKNLSLHQEQVGPLLAILSAGVGIGSVLAGLWSGGKVELGIVPLGAILIALSAAALSFTYGFDAPYFWTAAMLFALGAGGGLFNVPLAAFLQHRSPKETLGSILAAGNFLTFSGILLVSVLFGVLQGSMDVQSPAVFLLTGIATIPVALYAFFLIPGATIRMIVWLLSSTVYRVKVIGRENLPETGGALLVANHVSWIDGVLLLITSSRPIRMLVYADIANSRSLRWLSKTYQVISIKANDGPKAIVRALQEARDSVEAGDLVCIFAEGQITRTGELQPFQRGLLRIVKGTGAPVVPVYLGGLWGSIFSYRGGRLFWKRPRQWPFPVSIAFGKPLTEPDDVGQVRRAVEQLGVQAVQERREGQMVPPRLFLRKCRARRSTPKVADSSKQELTGGQLLAATLIFRRLLAGKVIAADEKMVGILLPPAVGSVLANTAVTLMKKVAVNLNYTLKNDDLNYCIDQCGIKHVLTSRKFIAMKPVELDAELIFLEDLKDQITTFDKIVAGLQAYLLPVFLLERLLGLTSIKPDDLLTVIFTSGSTGEPKGVMLSHHNVGSNIRAVDQVFHITAGDVLMGILPFFHSFGYTAGLWLTLTLDPKTVFHFNPLDARTIGKLCEKHGVTIVMATPTFLRGFLKRCTPEQMKTLDLVIVGAEKLPPELADAFHEKFGVTPTEGYGTTELSPVAAFNVPPHRAGDTDQVTTKPGTVGRVMPGAAAKVIDLDTGDDLSVGQDGLLLISGPNVMLGYLNQPEKTAELITDGWYNTGDIACIDDDGFITITGRLSRFSKIGGEMVPHIKIEQLIENILENSDDENPEPKVAVTAVPHEKKGERLVVLHKPLPPGISVDDVLQKLSDSDLPNLWIPSRDSFCEVEQIPLLGTGKLDLKAVKEMALQKFGPDA
jgi:acyl-[acyl-carrier-protein]-phospholipid O-acyltransferase/long-chain-fatty-acid--[acyl-carrier-protein] ligase